MRDDWARDADAPCGIEELVRQTKGAWGSGKGLIISGLAGGSKGFFISLLGREVAPVLVITPDQDQAEAVLADCLFFTPPEGQERILLVPSDGVPHGDIPPWDLISQRLKALRSIAEGKAAVVIAPIQGVQRKVPPKETLLASLIRIREGAEFDRDQLVRQVISLGYSRVETVEERGEMSLRGGIVDIYPLDRDDPLRMEFSGDRVESIRTFDIETQQSTMPVAEAAISPLLGEGEGSIFDYLSPATPLLLDNAPEIGHAAEAFWEQLQRVGGEERYLSPATVTPLLQSRPRAVIEGWRVVPSQEARSAQVTLCAASNEEVSQGIKKEGLRFLTDEIAGQLKEGWAVYLTVQNQGQGRRLVELLADFGLTTAIEPAFPPHPLIARGRLIVVVGDPQAGFRLPIERLAVVTEEEIFGLKRRVGHGRRAQTVPFSTFEDLRVGEHVVHVDYGIGLYRGLVRLETAAGGEGVENDYLLVEYAGGDKLYVPVHRFNMVHKYIGAGEGTPELDRLGGTAWIKTKRRVKSAVEDAARELLEIYAARKTFPGFSYTPPDAYFKEFEAAFAYEETPDQEKAIEEVLADMGEPRPTDRVICGDVGYGKTEVAIRAAFKAALDGKQVAVLVPTTVLAQQHYLTVAARLHGYPVAVEGLSRFKTRAEQEEILRQLRAGRIDIIIGTHRLLRDDVAFRDLGLLIIDEEHRFGVAHKERLKEMKKLVDCITLTATPIPRTLHMSLLGIRDLSLINTPPPNRQAIRTYLINFDEQVIAEAIRAEMGRRGQVFFVHNRVRDIDAMAGLLQGLVPGARLAVAHGQMRERALEQVMMRFVAGEIDLLVCTSIIESGLDIPNANTIIINHAERFGLADLYQLRGRVGRSTPRAFAYLICPPRSALSREAMRRLMAIQELSELGSGFRLAMRDLEIRGAGNLLGHVQSGHIADVGFELYNSLLEKAIRELKGEATAEAVTPEIHVPIEAFIPADYIVGDNQRLLFYKRLSLAADEEAVAGFSEELRDRFGPLPSSLLNLLEIIRLKIWLSTFSVKRFELKDNQAIVTFSPGGTISPEKVVQLVRGEGEKYRVTPDMRLIYTPATRDWKEVFAETRNILQRLV
jgi:transcription-repair coupling factor (superfamily II helicase)